MEMTISDFYNFYKTELQGKIYCENRKVANEYHYETEENGYDHLGHLGYSTVKVVDSYRDAVHGEKINGFNVIKCVRHVLEGEGWIENGND